VIRLLEGDLQFLSRSTSEVEVEKICRPAIKPIGRSPKMGVTTATELIPSAAGYEHVKQLMGLGAENMFQFLAHSSSWFQKLNFFGSSTNYNANGLDMFNSGGFFQNSTPKGSTL
jgi:hypothetical protein